MLIDYFKPLTPLLLLITVLIFLSLDIVGSYINRHLFKSSSLYRPVYWLYSLAPIVFIWYLLHFFLPFKPIYVALSLTLPALICLASYLKNKDYQSLFSFYLKNPFLTLTILTLFPALFVKSSLPPYLTDEVRYHFISPFQLLNQNTWGFGSNSEIYTYVPRFIETFLALVFSLARSYSPARLLHFLIFLTSISSIYAVTKYHFGHWSANLFVVIYLYLMKDLLIIGASGYTDYSLASFIALGIVSLFDFYQNKKSSILLTAVFFLGLSISTKFTGLSVLLTYGLITLGFLFYKKNQAILLEVFKARNMILLFAILFISGGYWYLNNFYFTGNPVYPFFFPCKLAFCAATETFFDGWTVPVTLRSLPTIINQITIKLPISVLWIASVGLIFRFGNKKQRYFAIFLLVGITLELFLLRFYSGFLPRYFFYLQILFTLLIVLPATRLSWYTLLVSFFALFYFISGMKTTYSIWHYLSPQEIAYARGKTNIYDWIKDRHPQNQDIIAFCADTGPHTLYILDQGIWHASTNEQFMAIFNINCTYASAPTPQSSFWFATTKTCAEEPLVCQAQSIGKNLYYLEQ